MARWALYLTPWLIWTAHFLVLYVLWSLEDLRGGSAAGWRMAAVALTVFGLAGIAACTLLIWRKRDRPREEGDRLMTDLAATGGVVAALAVLFQTVPVVFV